MKKGVLNRIANEHTEYRLSTTSHDSGFTSHDQQPINGSDDNNNENNMNHDRAIMRGRSASWKDWPKNGPYDSQLSIHRVPSSEHQNQQNDQFNLPAPPPECKFIWFQVEAVVQNGTKLKFYFSAYGSISSNI